MRIGFSQVVAEDDWDSYPFIGFAYLKSCAERDCPFPLQFEYSNNWRDLSASCDVVGLSCLSQDFDHVREAVRVLSARGHIVLLGGVHISERPEDLPPEATAAILFEGEQTFVEVLRALHEHGCVLDEHLSQIPGLAYRPTAKGADEAVVCTAPRPPMSMDELPFADRKFMIKPHHGLHMFTSRGCVYKCTFCSSAAYWQKFRRFSPEYVVDEVAYLSEAFPDKHRITLADDLFVADRRRMRRIVELLHARGLHDRFRTNCAIRIDQVDEDLCELLVGLNAEFVYFGLESGSPRIQRSLKHYRLGADVTPAQMGPALALLHRHGVVTNTTFIVGAPTETTDDLRATYEFLTEQTQLGHLSEAIANVLTPLPGTATWKQAVTDGYVTFPFEWQRLRYYAYLGKHHPRQLSVPQWADLRRRNRSLYVNPSMQEGALYEMMGYWEEELEAMRGRRRAPLWGRQSDVPAVLHR